MDFLRAFTYTFNDRHWLKKLAELSLFLVLCLVPVIGLICLCALLGYLAAIIHNVSNDYPRPLPTWNHIGEDIVKGLPVLLAIIIYHLPPVILLLLLYAFRSAIAVSLFGGITFIGVLTALLPLLLLYLVFAWSMLANGLVRYAETWERDSFYHINTLLRSLQTNAVLTLQWLITTAAASIILAALFPVALLGLVMFVPVQGYLTGNYGRRLRAARFAQRRGLSVA